MNPTRSIKRRLFTLAAAGSLVLCVLAATAWICRPRGAHTFLFLGWFCNVFASTEGIGLHIWVAFDSEASTFVSHWDHLGLTIGSEHRHVDGLETYWFIFMFYPLVVSILASLPVAWLARRCIRHRRLEGTCPACGYDLRATPERCPECGTAVPQPQPQPQPQKAGNA